MQIISNETKVQLLSISNSAPKKYSFAFEHIIYQINLQKEGWSKTSHNTKAGENVERIINATFDNLPSADNDIIKKCLVARLAVRCPDLVERMNLPPIILGLYSSAFDRLSNYLTDRKEKYSFNNDFFYKDIRFVLAMTVPCGSQVVDLTSKVPLYSVLLSVLRSKRIKPFFRYLNIHGCGNWFRIHLDSRHLDEFNKAGRDQCYKRIAELLLWDINVRGMVGTSWYYDPQLLGISPHLGYLHLDPLDRGAFLLRHSTGQNHIDLATKTSNTRKRLYIEGKYIPICHSILWPRKEIINWYHSL